MIAVPLLTAISFGLAAVAGHPVDGFLAAAVDLAGIGAGLALSNIFTVALPYPAEQRVGSPVPRPADGYSGHAIAGTIGSLFGVGAAGRAGDRGRGGSPARIRRRSRMPVLILCAAAYGIVLAWIGVRVAAGVAEPRLPELCQVALRTRL